MENGVYGAKAAHSGTGDNRTRRVRPSRCLFIMGDGGTRENTDTGGRIIINVKVFNPVTEDVYKKIAQRIAGERRTCMILFPMMGVGV